MTAVYEPQTKKVRRKIANVSYLDSLSSNALNALIMSSNNLALHAFM